MAFAPIGQGFDHSTSTRGTIGSRRKGGLISPVRWPPAVAVLHLRLRYDCRPSADRWSTPVPGGCLGRQGRAGVEGAGAGATARAAPGGSPGTVRPVREPEGSARTPPARHSAPRDARPRANHLAEPVTASSPQPPLRAASQGPMPACPGYDAPSVPATTPPPVTAPRAALGAGKRPQADPPDGQPTGRLAGAAPCAAPPRPTADLTHRQPGPPPDRPTARPVHRPTGSPTERPT